MLRTFVCEASRCILNKADKTQSYLLLLSGGGLSRGVSFVTYANVLFYAEIVKSKKTKQIKKENNKQKGSQS